MAKRCREKISDENIPEKKRAKIPENVPTRMTRSMKSLVEINGNVSEDKNVINKSKTNVNQTKSVQSEKSRVQSTANQSNNENSSPRRDKKVVQRKTSEKQTIMNVSSQAYKSDVCSDKEIQIERSRIQSIASQSNNGRTLQVKDKRVTQRKTNVNKIELTENVSSRARTSADQISEEVQSEIYSVQSRMSRPMKSLVEINGNVSEDKNVINKSKTNVNQTKSVQSEKSRVQSTANQSNNENSSPRRDKKVVQRKTSEKQTIMNVSSQAYKSDVCSDKEIQIERSRIQSIASQSNNGRTLQVKDKKVTQRKTNVNKIKLTENVSSRARTSADQISEEVQSEIYSVQSTASQSNNVYISPRRDEKDTFTRIQEPNLISSRVTRSMLKSGVTNNSLNFGKIQFDYIVDFPTVKEHVTVQSNNSKSKECSIESNTKNEVVSTHSKGVPVESQKVLAKKSQKQTKLPPIVGDFCFAYVRGYAPWPAIVTAIDGKNSAWVEFFNSGLRAKCSFSKIYNLFEGLPLIAKHRKNVAFKKAVNEMTIAIRAMMPNKPNEANLLQIILDATNNN